MKLELDNIKSQELFGKPLFKFLDERFFETAVRIKELAEALPTDFGSVGDDRQILFIAAECDKLTNIFGEMTRLDLEEIFGAPHAD